MTIKIKATKVWLRECDFRTYSIRVSSQEQSYRLVRESDWRKLMRLVKAADDHDCWPGECIDALKPRDVCNIRKALSALEKKK